MEKEQIKEKLYECIERGDERLLKIMLALVDEYNKEAIDPELERRRLIKLEREKYLSGEGKSFSWEEVKAMAINKEARNGL